MKSAKMIAIAASVLLSGVTGHAADLPGVPSDTPMPPESAMTAQQKGIWAAIAFSERDGKHGFFWGADTRSEAEKIAVQHCERVGGGSCKVAIVFRNHRHWNDNDGTGFPYDHCAALAVSNQSGSNFFSVAKSATNRKEAEELTLTACEKLSSQCSIREWICT